MNLDTPASDDSESSTEDSADAISSFVESWIRDKYFYSEAASLAHDICETLLASHAIRAIVTHRVKQGRRLEVKLRERVRKLGKEYKNSDEIRDDIIDLAGVRIALYFPSDREKIEKLIQDNFTVISQHSFPENEYKQSSNPNSITTDTSFEFEQRFGGYSADHYRVRLMVKNLAKGKLRDDLRKTRPTIEIQVASVLMHAWAEIDHDLVYKTLTSGPASQQERRLLDATNGLVHTGEVLLQQLQTAMNERVAYQNEPFGDQHELLSFLRKQIKKAQGPIEHSDILLVVLKITGSNSPWKLGQLLEGFILPDKENAQVALAIIEHVLSSLGNTERRADNPYLRPNSVRFKDLEIDETDCKYYNTDEKTSHEIMTQRDILDMTVSVVDIWRSPLRSILEVESMPQELQKFNALYNLVHSAIIKPYEKGNKRSARWLCEIELRYMDALWMWFEANDDILFRVSLMLARLNSGRIDQELIKLRPSRGVHWKKAIPSPRFARDSRSEAGRAMQDWHGATSRSSMPEWQTPRSILSDWSPPSNLHFNQILDVESVEEEDSQSKVKIHQETVQRPPSTPRLPKRKQEVEKNREISTAVSGNRKDRTQQYYTVADE